jgi:hypothetical protein
MTLLRPAAPLTPAFPSRLPAVGTTIFTVMSALAAEHQAVKTNGIKQKDGEGNEKKQQFKPRHDRCL